MMTFVYKNKEFTVKEFEKMIKKRRYGKKIEVAFPYEFLSFKINEVLYDSEYIEKAMARNIPLSPKLNTNSLLVCPICMHDIYRVDRYCSACGQRLDWRNEQ